VQGKDANPYLVICNFCTCRAFEGHTLASNKALLCKHSLAALLAHKWKVKNCARILQLNSASSSHCSKKPNRK
jgi:hypothetical protein